MQRLLESVLCSGIQLYLAGHDHDMEYISEGAYERCPEVAMAISGTGAQTRPFPGDQGASHRVQNSQFYDDRDLGFASIRATSSRLELRFIDASGKTLFEWERQRDAEEPPHQ